MRSPWPFVKWGIDIIDPLLPAKAQAKFAVVAIDYYAKWVETETLSKITKHNTTEFIWKNNIF